jgi:hypothetical protein
VSAADPLYPPSPAGIPADLTQPGWRYRWQVFRVLWVLFLFLAVFVILLGVAGLFMGWGVWLLDVRDLDDDSQRVLLGRMALGVGFLFMRTTLVAYLLKCFFRRADAVFPGYVEITEATQPELFRFVRTVCGEVGCAMPGRVYLDHAVNAGIMFPMSGWRLIIPPPKSPCGMTRAEETSTDGKAGARMVPGSDRASSVGAVFHPCQKPSTECMKPVNRKQPGKVARQTLCCGTIHNDLKVELAVISGPDC